MRGGGGGSGDRPSREESSLELRVEDFDLRARVVGASGRVEEAVHDRRLVHVAAPERHLDRQRLPGAEGAVGEDRRADDGALEAAVEVETADAIELARMRERRVDAEGER